VLKSSFNRCGAKDMLLRFGCASLALALFSQAGAAAPDDRRSERRTKPQQQQSRVEQPKALSSEGPLLMLVSLNQQRMYVYDSNGLVVQTRVSSGRSGHETPVGIYRILEKKVDHTSNIYLDAKMPHMQRLTMTGIALHGGVIPGYPASGGCVRLPYDFARRFFNMTDINQRVVIAPAVNAPTGFEHPLLFSGLPSTASLAGSGDRAESTGAKAIKIGVDAAGTLIGVTSAQAATDATVRTQESAAEARRAERQDLLTAVTAAGERQAAAVEGEKAAIGAISDAQAAAKAARSAAKAADRDAYKAKAALQSQERALKKIEARLNAKSIAKMRADALEALRAAEASERERLAPLNDDVARTANAAKDAAEAVKAADQAIAKALSDRKNAKAEIKDAAAAEVAAKKAVAAFDRQEQNRALPVSVFISSATGQVQVRQGFEPVIEAQATIENPEVPLDTFIFSAVDWKDDSKTDLKWQVTEVNEYSTRASSFENVGSRDKKKKTTAEAVKMPLETDTAKAARTLDRIRLPQDVADRIAEVVKPGSTLIVSSYDVARSETKYAGTDFIVQMPEVVAKITKPTPRPKPVEVVEDNSGGGCFFFCSSSSSSKYKDKDKYRERDRKPRRANGSKSAVW